MARARSVKSDSISVSGEENIWLSAGIVASILSAIDERTWVGRV